MNAAATDTPTPAGSEDPSRDTASWVLSAVTVGVLAIGVLVIRSTQPAPASLPPTIAPGEVAGPSIESTPDASQNVIVALPEPRNETPPAGARSASTGAERR